MDKEQGTRMTIESKSDKQLNKQAEATEQTKKEELYKSEYLLDLSI
jgi:hypothetical protein